jgi:hypothetical protein
VEWKHQNLKEQQVPYSAEGIMECFFLFFVFNQRLIAR